MGKKEAQDYFNYNLGENPPNIFQTLWAIIKYILKLPLNMIDARGLTNVNRITDGKAEFPLKGERFRKK